MLTAIAITMLAAAPVQADGEAVRAEALPAASTAHTRCDSCNLGYASGALIGAGIGFLGTVPMMYSYGGAMISGIAVGAGAAVGAYLAGAVMHRTGKFAIVLATGVMSGILLGVAGIALATSGAFPLIWLVAAGAAMVPAMVMAFNDAPLRPITSGPPSTATMH